MENAPSQWPGEVFRRYSVDIHVPDWDPALLANFDAVAWVDNMARAGNQSLLQYTNSHVGLCLWKTNIGQRHANMPQGRDFFGEVVAECRRRGIHPLAYFSVIFDNWAFEHHPDWRILPPDGYTQLNGRYGTVCPNSPYREYVFSCVREIVGNYDIDGMFFDMTFWPAVCYCTHCTARFWKEHGAEPPRVVNWDDPIWRAWQDSRQRWLREFALSATNTAKSVKPITVNHQFSTIFHNWTLGVPLEMTDACDYVGGDFYGGPAQHSLACKVYYGLTHRKPFEFHTSRTRDAADHVTVKPMDEMRTEAFVATLHSAALMLVDYINADGTLNPAVYDFLGRLSQQRAAFEPYLGGDLCADVGIYYDKASMYNPHEQGVHITRLQAVDQCPHRDAVVGAARLLQEAHIPFGVVTNANLDQLIAYRVVIVPNVLEMSAAQADVFRRFVAEGGVLYASGPSSLYRLDAPGPRFLLEDVLGVHYTGTLGTKITYLTPHDDLLRQSIWPQDHLSYAGPMMSAEPLSDTQVLAHITLPFVAPEKGRAIGSHFAGIHSNPPALHIEGHPAATLHRFGKGQAIWMAAPFEMSGERVNGQLVLSLLRAMFPGPYQFEADAHPAVEITLFDQPDKQRLLVGLLNTQRQLPQVPVSATVRVKPSVGREITSILRIPMNDVVQFRRAGAYTEFEVPPLDGIAMFLCNQT